MENHLKSKSNRRYKEGIDKGKSLRQNVTLQSHADFEVTDKRQVICELIEEQNKSRIEWLIPYRRGGMLQSPFTFYRGAARIMAYDLKDTPASGLEVQLCGDAHLGNFGVYASPERQLVYDLNDFDETLPGPWEWDVKRLVASFAIAGRHFGLPKKDIKSISALVAKAYRESMRKISKMTANDVWYHLITSEKLIRRFETKKGRQKAIKFIEKAKTKDHFHAFSKLTEIIDDVMGIIHDPPYIIPLKNLIKHHPQEENSNFVTDQYKLYHKSLLNHISNYLNNFQLVDAALKVVGVGSIGTSCHVVLFEHKAKAEPFLLQLKQAQASVLEEFLPKSRYKHSGRRVVEGQRLMQSVSDPFLGWSTGSITGNHYYWRQLKDWKASVSLEDLSRSKLEKMAVLRGITLARSHARTGDAIALAGYLGKNEKFEKSISKFSIEYAVQNENDYNIYKEYILDNQLSIEQRAN